MRLRGLPRELNCGHVELIPSKSCEFSSSFQTCISCGCTYLTYLRLDCSHILCEGCSVFYEDSIEQLQVLCTVCHEARLAKLESTNLSHVYLARFECPCGEEGHLHHLSKHRRFCKSVFRAGVSKLGSEPPPSPLPGPSSAFSLGLSAQKKGINDETPKPFEFVVKGYIAQELNRMKEDILNTTRVERQSSEATLQALQERVSILESRLNVNTGIQNRLEALERAAEHIHSFDTLNVRIESLARAVERINTRQIERLHEFFGGGSSSNSSGGGGVGGGGDDDSIGAMVNALLCGVIHLQSRSTFMWFDVKSLLRHYNNQRVPVETSDQTAVIAGYPCKVHLMIEEHNGSKVLAAYIAINDSCRSNASWPMKRRFTVRIFDHHCVSQFENCFITTSHSIREYFKGPGSRGCGTYYGVDMCTVEELTTLYVYQKGNGMICVGIEIDLI